eukprot:TRINITY_DN2248_c0_g1_i1.p1 TRINITY_DN2248_c0_g1~~TRINITY_DN2248_c0_g1_i1.p1  ORF type:complete len:197 (-),score=23.56 TRINITY_DN2248_c0_g1_i1:83-610(-)
MDYCFSLLCILVAALVFSSSPCLGGDAHVDIDDDLVTSGVEADSTVRFFGTPPPSNNTTCNCETGNCSCCVDADFSKLGYTFNHSVCAEMDYISKNETFAVGVTVDGKFVYKDTTDAKNPEPVCFGYTSIISLCINFFNTTHTHSHFDGCTQLQGSIWEHVVGSWDMGCYEIART